MCTRDPVLALYKNPVELYGSRAHNACITLDPVAGHTMRESLSALPHGTECVNFPITLSQTTHHTTQTRVQVIHTYTRPFLCSPFFPVFSWQQSCLHARPSYISPALRPLHFPYQPQDMEDSNKIHLEIISDTRYTVHVFGPKQDKL